jgi:hypothetical protein
MTFKYVLVDFGHGVPNYRGKNPYSTNPKSKAFWI